MLKEQLEQIRLLLDDVESELGSLSENEPAVDFSGVEVASVLADVVDYLQPLLTPYQGAFYWHLLRHSILKEGRDLIRVSTRGLAKGGVVKSARSEVVAPAQVKVLLSGLEAIGAIRKESDPNRDGTLYRVFLPESIEACNFLRNDKMAESAIVVAEEIEADYYNVRENRRKIYERDGYICHYCQKQLTILTVTLDHIVAVVEGGDNSEANLVTSCLPCNSRKNRKAVGDFLAENGG